MKKKIVSFEILRIASMFLIVLTHCMFHGRVLEDTQLYTLNQALVLFLRVMVMPAVDCYVLISGYFMLYKSFCIQRIFRIWLKTALYSIILWSLFRITGYVNGSWMNGIESIFPVLTKQYWYISVYIALCFLSPFLNQLILQMTKRQLQNLIAILLFYFCICASILPASQMIISAKGNDIVWFVCLYIVAAYIRLYYEPHRISNTKLLKAISLLLCLETIIVIVCFWSPVHKNMLTIICGHNSIWNAGVALLLFLIAVNESKRMADKPAFLFQLSASTLGVYLIHDNIWIRNWLWSFINPGQYAKNHYMLFILIGISIFIFMICSFVDMAGSKVVDHIADWAIQKMEIRKWSQRWNQWNRRMNEGMKHEI